MLKRIAIVGPESTGKTTLAEELAKYFKTSYAQEFAREYLINNGPDYKEKDLLSIAKGQINNEAKANKGAKEWVFYDTNLLVILVWQEYKYLKPNPELTKLHSPKNYDFYLLLKPDLPYQPDPLRENPNFEEREELFSIYKKKLEEEKAEFGIVEGSGEDRTKCALKLLDSKFN